MARPSVIAIDGPVASGKSSVGALLARRLGYRFVDTGTMYRALTWLACQRGMDPEDGQALAALARSARIEVRAGEAAGREAILVDGQDVTDRLREPRVDETVSLVSRFPRVREAMVRLQRALASQGNVVMVGRDIGTVVLPEADLKVYLDASLEERARRRQREMGGSSRVEDVMEDIRRRDAMDSGRAVSPLRPASDARILLTDGLSLEGVVETIWRWAEAGSSVKRAR